MSKRKSPKQKSQTPPASQQASATELKPTRPSLTERTLLCLPISEIQPYEKNPRRVENPNFSKIKESIAQSGLNQPLVVTQRPGHVKFIVYKGGNTRLRAITELFAETGDFRFRFIECSFVPWSGYESDAIIGHLLENEMRKSLCFIDKAYGIKCAIEHLHLESKENKNLSIRAIHSILVARGYSIPLSTLSVMLFAAETVEPFLATDACVSMGRRSMEKLRKLQKAFIKACKEFELSNEQAKNLFIKGLQDYSAPQWNYWLFRRSVEAKLSEHKATSVQDVSLRLNGYLNLSSKPLNETFEKVKDNIEKEEKRQKFKIECTKMVHEVSVRPANTSKKEYTMHQNGASESFVPLTLGVNLPSISDVNGAPRDKNPVSRSKQQSVQITALNRELEELRKHAYRIASRIAKRHGFFVNPKTKRSIIAETEDWGVGYLVIDYPPATERASTTEVAHRDALWWLLLEYSDLQWAIKCARPFTAKVIGNTDLLNYIKTGDPKTIILHAKSKMQCTFPHLGLVSLCHRRLSDDSWQDLDSLTDTYRSIQQLANNNNINLFRLPKQRGN